jgi:hypothetical protein
MYFVPSNYVMLRVPQRDGSIMYELYEERVRHPEGQRMVRFVAESPDIEWARRQVEELSIPERDARIEPRD